MIRLKRYELYSVPRCTRYSFIWNCLLITEIAELLFKVVLSTNNPTHQLTLTVTRRVPLVEQEQLTLPERGRRRRDRMVVGFTTTCAKSVPITTKVVGSNLAQPRCTLYNIMWEGLSMTCDRSVVFSGYSGFLQQ
jgi:hypothetical protein